MALRVHLARSTDACKLCRQGQKKGAQAPFFSETTRTDGICMTIVLSVKRSAFRRDDQYADEANTEFRKVRPSILSRDKHTCVECGHQSKKGLEVHHKDDNHDNNSPSNLVSMCPLCHACFHIGYVGAKRAGDLIYIPPEYGMAQASLNNLVRQLWVMEGSKDQSIAMMAVQLLARMHKLRVLARRHLGTSDPAMLADILLEMPPDDYAKRRESLSGVFLFPIRDGFRAHAAAAAEASNKTFAPHRWSEQSKKDALKWLSQPGDAHTLADLPELLSAVPDVL